MNKEVRIPQQEFTDFQHAKNTLPKKILLHFVIITIYTLFGKWKIEEEENMFKISLKEARELSGYTVEEVARNSGITVHEYNIIETDPSQSHLSVVLRITDFLGLSLDLVFPGNKADCLTYNRSRP